MDTITIILSTLAVVGTFLCAYFGFKALKNKNDTNLNLNQSTGMFSKKISQKISVDLGKKKDD